jgi:putative DNA primase/helicase
MTSLDDLTVTRVDDIWHVTCSNSLHLTVTVQGGVWRVTRPDDYALILRLVDVSRPGVWKAAVQAYAPAGFVTTGTVDILQSRERDTFQCDAAAMNGKIVVDWAQFLQYTYRAIEAVRASAGDAASWAPRQPLPPLIPAVPALPSDLLPPTLTAFVDDIAVRMQVPREYVAIPVLVSLGSVIGRQCGILPKRQDDWLVIPNLWGAIVGRSGLMKSPAAIQGLKPLARLVTLANQDAAALAAENAIACEVLDAQMAGVKEALKKAAKDDKTEAVRTHAARLAALQAERAALAPHARRFQTNDATIQKLGELLQDNPTGLLLYRDELSGWLSSLTQEGRNEDRAFFLEAWNGDGAYTFDRIGRGTVHVQGLCLSILGGIQPGKVAKYVYEASEGGDNDDGLLQRFQLLVWPTHDPDWTNVDRAPNSDARRLVERLYAQLAQFDPESLGASTDEFQPIPAFRFSADAQDLFDTWRADLEVRLRSEPPLPPAFESHLAKYRSLMPSLALIFHLVARIPTGEGSSDVSLAAATLAAAWCEFLEAHAQKVYAGVLHKDLQAAHALAEKIRSGAVVDGQTVRDLYRNGWALLRTPDDVQGGLTLLEHLGWLRIDEEAPGLKGGRAKEIIHLHPDFRPTEYA